MLSADLEVLDKIANDSGTWSHHREALQRIKKIVELAQQTTNKQSVKCSQCGVDVVNVRCSKCEEEFQSMLGAI